MENQALDVSQELKKIEPLIGKIMTEYAQEERTEAQQQIKKLASNIEEILIHEASIPSNIAFKFVENLNEKLSYDIKKNITSSREGEFEETKNNLSTVEQSDKKETMDRLDYFGQDGIAINNRKYEQNLDEICEEVFREVKNRLNIVGSRQVEETIYDIKKMINRTQNNIQDIHGDFSKKIKKEVSKKVEDLYVRLNEEKLDKDGHNAESKDVKELSDFESMLQKQRRSQEEITQDDVNDLSLNQKSFKSEPERNENRKKFEAMFK